MMNYYECLGLMYLETETNLNTHTPENDVSLKDIVNEGMKFFEKVNDATRFSRAWIYYQDGEKYRFFNDQRTHNYFKKRCVEEYKKIKNPALIQKFEEEMGSYLPKKISKNKIM